jgi:hypothetical protein
MSALITTPGMPTYLTLPRTRVPNDLQLRCGRPGMGQAHQLSPAGTKLVIIH